MIAALQVKNPAFVTTDSTGLSIEGKELLCGRETLILSSLWNTRGGKFSFTVRCTRVGLLVLLLLLCGDVERCPGPFNRNCSRNIPELNTLLQKRGIKVLHQNVRGLFTNMAYIADIFESFRGIDILSLSETHIDQKHDNMPLRLFDIQGYSFISRPRPDGKGGGSNSDFEDLLSRMLTKVSDESKETIFLGDMNANYLVPGDNKKLKSTFELFGLKQSVLKPTRITATSKSLIDIILTNTPQNLIATDVIPMGIGDHEMVGCVRKINTAKYNSFFA